MSDHETIAPHGGTLVDLVATGADAERQEAGRRLLAVGAHGVQPRQHDRERPGEADERGHAPGEHRCDEVGAACHVPAA